MNRQSIFVLATVLFMWSSCHAIVVEYDLNCEGSYIKGNSWTTAFDLGVEFPEISDIYINWSGSLKGVEWAHKISVIKIEPACDSSFKAELYDLPTSLPLSVASVYGGEETYPEYEEFSECSEFIMSDYSAFFDGIGAIKIRFLETYPPYYRPTNLIKLSAGGGELLSGKLVFVGTEVPEPCTLLFFVLGGVLLRRRK
jgi:hypothetical protein